MVPMGKGAIPADHPLCCGVTFTWVTADLQNMEKSVSPLVIMADAALAVGFRFSQLATVNYTLPVPKSLVQIDVDPVEIGANYDVTVGILSDAKRALRELRDALEVEGIESEARSSWIPDAVRPPKQIDVGPASRPPVDWWELFLVVCFDALYIKVDQFAARDPLRLECAMDILDRRFQKMKPCRSSA